MGKKLFICILLLIVAQTTLAAVREKIVLVDGISADRTNKCNKLTNGGFACEDGKPYDRPSYLLSDLKPYFLAKGVSANDIYAFQWSGDMVTHGEGLKNKFTRWFYGTVCGVNDICNVSFIAHSWGTVITTDFIKDIPSYSPIKIRTVVTFGSPVTGAQIQWGYTPFWKAAINKVVSSANNLDGKPARWVNIVNRSDFVAWDYTEVNGVENLQPSGGYSSKGRLPERFPVVGSEFDPKFLSVPMKVCVAVVGATPKVVIEQIKSVVTLNCATGIAINTLSIIVKSWGVNIPLNPQEFMNKLMQEHSTAAYNPNKVASYVTDRLPKNTTTASVPAAVAKLDRCIAIFKDYVGSKVGTATLEDGYYNQQTTGGTKGKITWVSVDKDLRENLLWYYWGGWGSLPLSQCN